jgi:DNA-binding Lrp family transcriptional regulator
MLDRVDKKIIKTLQSNSKQSLRDISKAVGVSEATVFNRIKRIEKEGIIEKYTIKLNLEKFGEWFTAVTAITLESGKWILEVVEKLKKVENVHVIYDVTGDFDLMVIQRFKERDELFKFIRMVSAMPRVAHTRSWVVMKIFKEDFAEGFIEL